MDTWDVTDTGQPTRQVDFTVTEGSWLSLDVSPDGRHIAFDLLGDVFVIPAEGGEARVVRDGPTMDRMPAFSADGEHLLFLSDADGWDNVWTCRVDGSDPVQLTYERHGLLTGPAWGPDPDSFLAARIDHETSLARRSEICLFERLGPDPGEGRVLVATPENGRDVLEPGCSADGRFVYYTERLTNPYLYVDANHIHFAVRRLDLRDGSRETLASGFGGAFCPRVSPDGAYVAFVRRVMARTVLFVLDLESGEQRPVYDRLDRDNSAVFELQGNHFPRFGWFPDSRRVAIWSGGHITSVDTHTACAEVIPFRARYRKAVVEPLRVRHDPAPPVVPVRAVKDLAPAEGWTAFTAVTQVWVRDAAGAITPVSTRGAVGFDPAASADSTKLTFVEWDDELGSTLVVLDVQSEQRHAVTHSRGVIRNPVLSADGSQVAYRIQEPDTAMGGARVRQGLYVVDAAGDQTPHFVGAAQGPVRFSPDGRRLFVVTTEETDEDVVEALVSCRSDGQDQRVHARAANEDVSHLRISPDLRWLAFRDGQHLFAVPLRDTGLPLTVSSQLRQAPLLRLGDDAGVALAWSPDSSTVHWAVGDQLRSVAVPGGFRSTPAQVVHDRVDLTLSADLPTGRVAFVNARVITMVDEEILDRGTVLVEGNRIVAVGPDEEVAVPSDAHVVDAAGRTLLPGFIDGHGHIDSAWSTGVAPRQQPWRLAALSFGVTTNFDPFPSELASYESTEATQVGVMPGPRWIGTGRAMHGRPRIGSEMYTPIHELRDAQVAVGLRAALGGRCLKSYKQPARRQRQMILKAAREAGLNVVIEGETHFYNNVSAILDGHTNLEHNLPLANYYDDVVQLMLQAGAHNTPTLIVCYGELFGENYLYQATRAWEDPKVRTFVQEHISNYSPLGTPYGAPPHVRAMSSIHVAEEIYDIGVLSVSRAVKKLDDAGVTINVGSHGQIPGLAFHWEMRLLAGGGMRPIRVLRAATINPARTLGIDEHLGTIEVGKLADLIVLGQDPLTDISHTNSVELTMVNGRLFDSATMDEIGNHDRPRTPFYWEAQDVHGIRWSEAWARR